MFIEKIRIENFKSIYDPLELDFTNIRGLWKINGDVGSGKTTIGEAVIFGLFGSIKGKNNADLISWGKKHGLIEVWCRARNKSIYIKREINAYGMSPIYVEVDGEEVIFTNKRDAQSQLENEYYDISRVTVELLCIISFNNFKSLATLNTSDTKKFLDQVLGFYILTQYSDVCKELRNDNRQKITEVNNSIRNIQGQINKLKDIANMARIEGDLTQVKKDKKELDERLKQLTSEYKESKELITKELEELNAKLSSIKTLGANKKKEIDFIEKGTCPTCGASIDQSQLEIKKKEREVLLENYNDVNRKVIQKRGELGECANTYTLEKNKLNEKITEVNSLKYKLEEQARRQTINEDEIMSLEAQVQEYNNDIMKYTQEDTEWEMLWNILSNEIRSKILASFIPTLNENIIKYSQRLQQPYVISFDSAFKCNIRLGGMDQDIALSSLSTGQLKTVDMIIILGVLGTILGGESCNVMFLDELFSNLHSDLRNEMCGVLKDFISEDQTLFIISHYDLDDRYFDGTIKMRLERKNQYEQHSIISINGNI
jgi:DNA repair exonuclease SbcCD ATPase subunit